MSTLTSIPVSDPKRFLTLQDGYKQELMGDQRLEEASALAARRKMLLENKQVDPHWALPQVKAMSRKLHRLAQRIRQPFGSTPSSENMFPPEMEDTADDFAAGPVQALVKRLIQSSPAAIKTPPNRPPVKRKVDPFPQPVTPSTRKAKLVFRGNKAKPKLCIDLIWVPPFSLTQLPLQPVQHPYRRHPHPQAKLILGYRR